MREQHRFDLTELDAVATYLHLVVPATEELQDAVGAVAGEVARLVEPGSGHGGKRIRDESLSGEIGTVEISACDTVTSDEQLAGDTDRHGLQMAVQDIELRVGDGPADRHGAFDVFAGGYLIDAAADDRLCRPVFVDQPSLGRVLAPERQMLARQGLATDHENPRASGGLVRRELATEQIEVCGGELDEAETALSLKRGREGLDFVDLRHQMHAPSGKEWGEQRRDREIEADRRVQRSACTLGDVVRVDTPLR